MKYKSFYIWWVVVLLLMTGTFWVGYEGYITDFWMKDETYLTTVMAATLFYCMGLLGIVSWKVSNRELNPQISKMVNRVWFLSKVEMGLAILGTSIGLILLFDVSTVPTAGDATAMQALLNSLWSNMGTAFYPNSLGLFSSLLLKISVYFITEDVTDHEE